MTATPSNRYLGPQGRVLEWKHWSARLVTGYSRGVKHTARKLDLALGSSLLGLPGDQRALEVGPCARVGNGHW